MADLSEYKELEGITFPEDVKRLMQAFADAWTECRADDCRSCEYRRKEKYSLLLCLSERYARKVLEAGVAPVRRGHWKDKMNPRWPYSHDECSECGWWNTRNAKCYDTGEKKGHSLNYCPNCGAKMECGDHEQN